jgi:Prealbumin-like fold domain
MQLQRFRIVLPVLALSSWFFEAQAQSVSGTGIEGVITIGPIRPGPPSDVIPSSKPLANATFAVESENRVITSFTTDEQGRFRILLEPGHYTVSMKDKKGAMGRYGRFDVHVIAGQMTKVEWQCDTGLR